MKNSLVASFFGLGCFLLVIVGSYSKILLKEYEGESLQFFSVLLVVLTRVSLSLVFRQLSTVFGEHHYDTAKHLSKIYSKKSRTSEPKELSFAQDQGPFLVCMEYSRAVTNLDYFKQEKIEYHQFYASLQNNLYCAKILVSSSADYSNLKEKSNSLDFSLFIPFPSSLKIDPTVHYIFHYLFEDSLREKRTAMIATGEEEEEQERENSFSSSFHPFVSHFLSLKKIGIYFMFDRPLPKEEKQTLVARWKRELTSFLPVDRFQSRLHRLFDTTVPASSTTVNDDRSSHHYSAKMRSSAYKSSRLFPVSHYLEIGREMAEEQINSCASLLFSSSDDDDQMDIRFHQFGILWVTPSALLEKMRNGQNGHSVDRKKAVACLLRVMATIGGGEQGGGAVAPVVQKIAFSSPVRLLNNLGREITQSGATGGAGEILTAAGLTGAGIVLGVSDTGVDENSCFFRDPVLGKVPRSADLTKPHTDNRYRKVIQYVNFSGSGGDYNSGHGSHVSATLAGNCVSCDANTAQYNGMASAAKLAVFDIGVDDAQQDLVLPEDMGFVFGAAQSAGARVHSNSWGGDIFYDSLSLETDEFLYRNKNFLVFFAAGNSGSSGKETVLSPGTAKNAVAVACTESGHSGGQNINYIASFSSNGPSIDGRIKPDIAGPGYSIISAKAHGEHQKTATCDTESKAGTSMATPVVAGNAGLIVQYFSDPRFWKKYCNPAYSRCRSAQSTPLQISGSLLKALVLHSGKGMAAYHGPSKMTTLGYPPDNYQGYGRMDLAQLLPLSVYQSSPVQLFIEENSLAQLTERKYFITFPSQAVTGAVPFKVTLSWRDPPNREFVSQLVLNDLDLVVTDPAGNSFFGNSPNSQTGTPVLGARRDEMNNNEQLTFLSPVGGQWTISVQAKALNHYFATEAEKENGEGDSSGSNPSTPSTQDYSLVVTSPRGTVVDTSQSSELHSLSVGLLVSCPAWDSAWLRPKLSLETAVWSRVSGRGWTAGDYYEILSGDYEKSGLGSDQGSVVYKSTGFSFGPFPFSSDSLCLSPGHYTASLVINSAQSTRGSQMGLPQCDELFLTPFSPKKSFLVLNATAVTDSRYDNSSYKIFPSDQKNCLSSCRASDHVTVFTTLVEWGGEGWSGGYYSIMSDSPNYTGMTTGGSGGGGVGGEEWSFFSTSDTLNWDYYEAHSVCVPMPSPVTTTSHQTQSQSSLSQEQQQHTEGQGEQCYVIQLTVPAGTQDDPQIYFTNAIYGTSAGVGEGVECLFQMNTSFSLAKFCLPPPSFTTTEGETGPTTTPVSVPLRFFSQYSDIHDLGMKKSIGLDYGQYYQNYVRDDKLRFLGECSMTVNYVRVAHHYHNNDNENNNPPTDPPSVSPTDSPSLLPSLSPSLSPAALPTSLPSVAIIEPSLKPVIEESPLTFLPSLSPTANPSLSPSPVPSTPPTTLVPSSIAPSVTPSRVPSAYPSHTSSPTHSDDDGLEATDKNYRYSLSCLKDCAGYPGDTDFHQIGGIISPALDDLCMFLVQLFYLCDSFSVAQGVCYHSLLTENYAKNSSSGSSAYAVYHECAKDCTIESLCYLGSGMITSCPDGRKWVVHTNESREIRNQCQASLYQDAMEGDNSDSGSSTSTSSADKLTLAFLIGKTKIVFLSYFSFSLHLILFFPLLLFLSPVLLFPQWFV
jgi:hypothetical protein